jgi:hypothetical protein
MVTDTKRPSDNEKITSTEFVTASVLATPGQAVITAPLILELRKRNATNRKYSRGTRNSQRLALGVSKAAYRVSNSFAEGFWSFAERSDNSAHNRRDGMVRDSLRNGSKGIEKGFNELGKAPGEITRRISGRTVWRTFRMFTF